jgi:NAD(P)-dependent dehydrogenase (short-subunit alcohol dehydrogenase family)
MSRVADKVVLVTGAGSGIGRATAALLAKEGATVIVTDVNKPGGLETVQQIGGRARFAEQDTSKEADWKRIIDEILAREGKLNGLVNNAGISGPFLPPSRPGRSSGSRRSYRSASRACSSAASATCQRSGARATARSSTSSLAAFLGTPISQPMARAGRGAAVHKTVAMDCARKGLQSALQLGTSSIIMTPMGASVLPNDKCASAPSAFHQRLRAPEDIACGILYLISDESRFVTGAELVIDGGMNAI